MSRAAPSKSTRPLFAATLVACLLLALEGSAAEYRAETRSIGRATHTLGAAGTVATRRIYTQTVDAWAYDLTGRETGSLAARFGARFTTDFALPQQRRDSPLFASDWNHFAMDVGYLRWRPVRGFEIRAGRQWSQGPLGTRDHDGLRLRLEGRLDAAATGHVVAFGGREVELTRTRFNHDAFDVQGIPRRDTGQTPADFRADGSAWVAGGRAGLGFSEDGSLDLAYRRRWRTTGGTQNDETRVGSERLGAALSMSPHPALTLSTHAAYHVQLDGIDSAALEAAWNLPGNRSVLTAGVEHRHPWFDSASIFNIFGARPHQGAHAVYQLPVESLPTTLDLRTWGRIYHGHPGPGRRVDPATTSHRLGGAVAHDSRISPFGQRVDWTTELSVESDLAGQEGAHVLADNRLRAPVMFEGFYVDGRFLWLYADSGRRDRSAEAASSWVLGVDAPLEEVGRLAISLEHTAGSVRRPTTNLYGTLTLEFDG